MIDQIDIRIPNLGKTECDEGNEIQKSAEEHVVQSVVKLTSKLQSPQFAHQIKSRFRPWTRWVLLFSRPNLYK